MIEQIILDFFNENLEIPTFSLEQEDIDSFVTIEKVGSRKENYIERATIAFKSYAPTLEGAALLNEQVKATAEKMISLGDVARVELNSDYNFTDESQKRYRYQAIFDFVFY